MADQQTPSIANPIRVVLVDTAGNIIGSLPVTIADNGDFALGSVADAQWSGSGSATAIAILKKIAVTGVGGGPATIADGADVAEGALADAAVVSDANGTVSGKLRGLVKIFADVWDGVNHRLNVALPAATVTTLTPPAAITGFALDATLVSSNTKLDTLHTDLAAQARLVDTQPVSNANLDATIGTEDSSTVPTKAVMVAGKTADAMPLLEALPLGPQGRSLLVEPIAPSAFDIALLREMRLLRQSFQDWTGTSPREDPIQVNS